MSGHSKWSQIKRQKGVADQRRGALFSKLTREIIVAARQGAHPESNFRLRLVVQKARDADMPVDNIERAIKRGAGGGEGAQMVEVTLEGYGPKGVAVIVQALSDNRNRTVQEVRNVFMRGGGSMAESGAVNWLFEMKGVITVESEGKDAEELALAAIDAGAEDVKTEKGYVEIYTTPQQLEAVRKAIEQKMKVTSAEISHVPKTLVSVGEKDTVQILKFLEALEDLEDVQSVYSNADLSDAVLERIRAQA